MFLSMPITIYFQSYLFFSVLKPYSQFWFCPILSLGMCRPFTPFRQKDLFFHLTFVLLHLTGNCLSCRSSGIEHARSKYFMVNVFYDISFRMSFNNVQIKWYTRLVTYMIIPYRGRHFRNILSFVLHSLFAIRHFS